MKACKLFIVGFIAVVSGCVANPSVPTVDSNNIVRLNDVPAVEFSTSGYSYTNTTNPFILTPDTLTNAMIGVSRLKVGEAFLRSETKVPTSLDTNSIRRALTERLKDKDNLNVVTKVINNRNIVIANYNDKNKLSIELAFKLKGHLVHILLKAKKGQYFNHATYVATNIVKTIKAK